MEQQNAVESREELSAPDDWLYFKLYLGRATDKLDSLILDLVPRLLAFGGLERWFFLRYVDEHGVHLRLRVKTREGGTGPAAEAVRRVCEEALGRIPQLPPAEYRPMVLPPGFDPHGELPIANPTVQLRVERYEPELDKFEGPQGMVVAEKVFETSSRIAFTVMRDEAAGRYSRKTLAPCFMDLVAASFPPVEGPETFWRNYGLYWLGGSTPAANDWRQRFLAKGRELGEGGIPLVLAAEELPREAARLLDEWRVALESAASGYSRLTSGTARTSVLAFNFAHLMNNRLGMLSLEEAYLAALLEQRMAREAA